MELECLGLLIIGSIVSILSASPETRCVHETSDQIDFYTTENDGSFTLQSGRKRSKSQVQSWSQFNSDRKTFYGFLTNREESDADQAIAVSTGVTEKSNFYIELSTLTEHDNNSMFVLSLELTCNEDKVLKFDQYYMRENENHVIQGTQTVFNSPFSCKTRYQLTILIDYTNKVIRIFDNAVQLGTMKDDLGHFPFNNLKKRVSIHGDVSVKDVEIYEIDSLNKNSHRTSRSDCHKEDLYLHSSDPDGRRRLMSYVELDTSHLGNSSLELIELKKDLNRAFFTNYAVSMQFTPRVSDDSYEIQILDGNENTRLHISVDVEQQQISFQERMHGEKWLENVDVSFAGGIYWNVPVEITVQRLENGYMVYYNGEKVVEYEQRLSIDDRLMLRPSVLLTGHLETVVISYRYYPEDYTLLTKQEADRWFISGNNHGSEEYSFNNVLPFGQIDEAYDKTLLTENTQVPRKAYLLSMGLDLGYGIMLKGDFPEEFSFELTGLRQSFKFEFDQTSNALVVDGAHRIILPSEAIDSISIMRTQKDYLDIHMNSKQISRLLYDTTAGFTVYASSLDMIVNYFYLSKVTRSPKFDQLFWIRNGETVGFHKVVEKNVPLEAFLAFSSIPYFNAFNQSIGRTLENNGLMVIQGTWKKDGLIHIMLEDKLKSHFLDIVVAEDDSLQGQQLVTFSIPCDKQILPSKSRVHWTIDEPYEISILKEEHGFRVFNSKTQIALLSFRDACKFTDDSELFFYALHGFPGKLVIGRLPGGLEMVPFDSPSLDKRKWLLQQKTRQSTITRVNAIDLGKLREIKGEKILNKGFSSGFGLEVHGFHAENSKSFEIALHNADHSVKYSIRTLFGEKNIISIEENTGANNNKVEAFNSFEVEENFELMILLDKSALSMYDAGIKILSLEVEKNILEPNTAFVSLSSEGDRTNMSHIAYFYAYESVDEDVKMVTPADIEPAKDKSKCFDIRRHLKVTEYTGAMLLMKLKAFIDVVLEADDECLDKNKMQALKELRKIVFKKILKQAWKAFWKAVKPIVKRFLIKLAQAVLYKALTALVVKFGAPLLVAAGVIIGVLTVIDIVTDVVDLILFFEPLLVTIGIPWSDGGIKNVTLPASSYHNSTFSLLYTNCTLKVFQDDNELGDVLLPQSREPGRHMARVETDLPLEEMTVLQINTAPETASYSPFVMTIASKDWKQAVIQPPLLKNSELLLKIDYADNGGKCYFFVYGDDSKVALNFDLKHTPEYDYMELCFGPPNSKCRHYPNLNLAAKGSQATIKISLRNSYIIFYLNDVILGVHDIGQSHGMSKLTHAKSKLCNVQGGYVAVKSDEAVENVEINWFHGSTARMDLVPSILLGKYEVSTRKELHLPEPFGHRYLLILNVQDIPRSNKFEIKFKTRMELIYTLKFISENDKPKLIVEYGTHLESLDLNWNSDTQNKQIVLLNKQHHVVLIVFGQRFAIMKKRSSASPTQLEFDAEKINMVNFYRRSDSIDSTSSIMQYELVTMSPKSCKEILVEEGMYSRIRMIEPWTTEKIEIGLPNGLTSLQLMFKKCKSDNRFLFFQIRVVDENVEIFAEQKDNMENPDVKRHVEKANMNDLREGTPVSVTVQATNDEKYEIYLNGHKFEIPFDSMDNQYSYLTTDAEEAKLCLISQDDSQSEDGVDSEKVAKFGAPRDSKLESICFSDDGKCC